MSLEELIRNDITDKNTTHSYIPLYQKLLEGKKETAKNVLEIGIYNGGSIKLWSEFFTNATIYGLDIMCIEDIWCETMKENIDNCETMKENIDNKNIKLYTSYDAYDENTFKLNFLCKGIKFDFMLDDGPHTLESMEMFIKLYSQIMTDDGILIIEDVQDYKWIDILKLAVPDNLQKYIKVYDLRQNKGRYDDIVFTIDKSNN